MSEQVLDRVEEASVVSEQEVQEVVDEMNANHEDYVMKLVEEFDETKVNELRKTIDEYAVYVDEFADKINSLFDSSTEVSLDDVLPQDPEKEDPRALKLYQEVGPVYPILKHHGKIPEDVDAKLNESSTKIQNAIQLGVSLYQISTEEQEQAVHQRDMQLLQAVYGMVSFQFINIARTLRKARLDGYLSEQLIEEMRLTASNIFEKTNHYLTFMDLDKINLENSYKNVRVIIERYTQFVNHVIGDNTENHEIELLDAVEP